MIHSEEKKLLRYKRQYLISPDNLKVNYVCNKHFITDDYILFAHIDLKITVSKNRVKKIILLGDLFDYSNSSSPNQDILDRLFNLDFNELTLALDQFTGRYVLIYVDENNFKVLHDAMATRKIYYSIVNQKYWLASSPDLLADYLNLAVSSKPEKISFYSSQTFKSLNSSNIGNTTKFDEISQLLPNHYIDLKENCITRFWPNRVIEKKDPHEVAQKCAKILSGYMESISNRYKIMMPLTAGKDSRTLLAASKKILDKIYLYINKEPQMAEDYIDLVVPKKLARMFGFKHHILIPSQEIDPDFKEIYYKNNKLASEFFLPHIHNYYQNFSDTVNLPGEFVGTAAYFLAGKALGSLEAKKLAKVIGVEKYQYAVVYYENWIKEIEKICKTYKINVMTLFYWEERAANWGTQIIMDKDIAQEDILPFNSRELIELFISVETKYNSKPDFYLNTLIIKQLWPELLKVPINPSFKSIAGYFLKKIGIFTSIKSFRNHFSSFVLSF